MINMCDSNNAAQMVYDDFKNERPDLCANVVDWYQSGQLEIVLKLLNGDKIVYDYIGKTVRRIKPYEPGTCPSKDEWSVQFGRRLERRMRMLSIGQVELAEKVGISQPQLSQYINGRVAPSGYIIMRLASALKSSVSELMWSE